MALSLSTALTGLAGLILIAAGMWRLELRAWRGGGHDTAATIAMMVCGIAGVIAASFWVGARPAVRIGLAGSYSAAAAFAGATAASIRVKRHAGAVLANLGTGVPRGLLVVAAVACVVGIGGIVVELFEPGPHDSLVALGGRAAFFGVLGIRSWLMAKTPWVFAEQGILGPSASVPWRRVSAYEWPEDGTLAITTTGRFPTVRRLRIPVAPEARERAGETLALKLARR